MAKTTSVKGRGGARVGSTELGTDGQTWQGLARRGMAGQGMAGEAGLGRARSGTARLGSAGVAGEAGQGEVRHGKVRNGVARPARTDGEITIDLPVITAANIEVVKISVPNFGRATLRVRGTGPYVQHAFSQKARLKMEETQRAGSRSRTRKTREARNFDDDYEQAMHHSEEGWNGIPASAFRNSMISACKVVGFFQTRAKLAIFVEADGFDLVDGTPLIKIIGSPEVHKGYARNESGVADLRWRPMWRQWEAVVTVSFDADMLSATDISNLLMRAGKQIGIGEGRPDSPNSNGLGWGTFEVLP